MQLRGMAHRDILSEKTAEWFPCFYRMPHCGQFRETFLTLPTFRLTSSGTEKQYRVQTYIQIGGGGLCPDCQCHF